MDPADLNVVLLVGAGLLLVAVGAVRISTKAGLPTLLLDGALGKIPETYRLLGPILGRPEAAEARAPRTPRGQACRDARARPRKREDAEPRRSRGPSRRGAGLAKIPAGMA